MSFLIEKIQCRMAVILLAGYVGAVSMDAAAVSGNKPSADPIPTGVKNDPRVVEFPSYKHYTVALEVSQIRNYGLKGQQYCVWGFMNPLGHVLDESYVTQDENGKDVFPSTFLFKLNEGKSFSDNFPDIPRVMVPSRTSQQPADVPQDSFYFANRIAFNFDKYHMMEKELNERAEQDGNPQKGYLNPENVFFNTKGYPASGKYVQVCGKLTQLMGVDKENYDIYISADLPDDILDGSAPAPSVPILAVNFWQVVSKSEYLRKLRMVNAKYLLEGAYGLTTQKDYERGYFYRHDQLGPVVSTLDGEAEARNMTIAVLLSALVKKLDEPAKDDQYGEN